MCFQNVHLGRVNLTYVLLADPDRYRPALRLPPGSRGRYRPTPGFCASPLSVLRRWIGVEPIPPPPPPKKKKKASRGSANPNKMASAAPSKSAPKGSAGPLKTAASKDDSSSSRRSPTKVRVDGVLVDVEGFSHPRRSTPSSRPQVPPNPKVPDRQSKAERNLVLSNQYSALSDDEMESSSIL